MEKNKFWGGVVIAVAIFVLFSAMWDARVSAGVAVVALLGLGIWKLAKGESPAGKIDELNKAREEKVEENKEKILLLLQSKGKIKNKDVEETLSVSDATATRYLDELEKEGKIKQVGGEQKDTYYSKT